jgi:hypothetical protein
MAKCECLRCGYKWQSEVDSPVKCAGCRSPLWNQARRYRLKDRPEVVPTMARRPLSTLPDKLHGVTMQDLLEVLREFESEFPVYARELRALKSIVKDAFKS